MESVNENKCITAVRIPTKVIDENYGIHDVWEFRRKIKLLKRWCYRALRERTIPYGNSIRSFRDLIGNENPRRTSCLVSARLKCLALGVASASNTRLFALLNYKRTRTENLLILRWSENRLSQVLTLFYSRIPEQNFLFDMIYDCLFESVWFTFREQVAPAPNQNLDKIKAFRLSASCHSCNEWQAAGSRRK